mmetsp:Transcript_1097/g.2706  ORF Transcript_1097/g.2706 Transcript_1097/m.2706 type:complete len:316 (-) Transcript_1097:59-1006(-)
MGDDGGSAQVEVRYLVPSLKGQGRASYTAESRPKVTHACGVTLRNGRRLLDGVSKGDADDPGTREQLERRGFTMVRGFRSAAHDRLESIENPLVYRSDKTVPESVESMAARDIYFKECEDLVQRLTGADVAFHISHAVRNGVGNKLSKDVEYLTAYATFAHTDYTAEIVPNAWKMLVKRGVPEAQAKRMRVTFMNVWQPTTVPVEQHPLALLDWTSVDPDDVVSVTLGYSVTPKAGEGTMQPPIAQLVHNERHRWYFFPNMQTDEALVFTQVDGRDEFPRHSFHTAVKHSIKPNPVARQSVEVRILCGFLDRSAL